jgi:cytochrome c
MPAYGGVIGTDGVWMLVAYLKAQTLPTVVPTTSWLPGGNASPNPAPAPTAAAAPAAPVSKAPMPPDQLPARYGCTACHAVDHKVVGPAFRDVAARYKGRNVVDTLVAKVRKGGFGNWGQVPMVPNPAVPDQDLQRVVQWILALK